MIVSNRALHRRALAGFSLSLIAAAIAAVALPAIAADAAPVDAPKETVTEELIRLLAEHNALSKDDAAKLIHRLQSEQAPPQQAQSAAPSATGEAAAPGAPVPPAVAEDKGKVRVIYVPESEKQKIRDEVKQEVLATAQAEHWAAPNALPEWVNRIRFDGDFRFRQEFDFYDSSNAPDGFVNFQSINSGAPINLTNNGQQIDLPFLNSTQNREEPVLRARIGLTAAVADDVTAGFRFATGNTNSPVSTNQVLGTDFNKVNFLVDRAYLNYRPATGVSLWAGRIPNPWHSTDLVWDDDINFDGVAAQLSTALQENLKLRGTLGAFSVENTNFNFPSTSAEKIGSRDKWLFGGQLGADWSVQHDLLIKSSVAFYDFYHLEGKLSSPCLTPDATVSCDTDDTRPGFLQKGNTVFDLRQIRNQAPTDPVFQYFGLASPFRVLDALLTIDETLKGNIHLVLDLDYANNLAFNSTAVRSLGPENNIAPSISLSNGTVIPGQYSGGNQAYQFQFLFGYPKVVERWNWNFAGGYKRLESDSVVDAFTDADFHFGGTNAKGYFLNGSLAFAHNTWLQFRWFSATEVTGPPLAIDVLQLDLNARF